jgi:hypothetical protein
MRTVTRVKGTRGTNNVGSPSTTRRRLGVLGAVAAIAAVATVALAGVGTAIGIAHGPTMAGATTTSKHGLQASAIEAALASYAAREARGPAGSGAAQLTDSTGMPTCAPPAIPAATYPPGQSYGIPFLAAITDGQVLAGYDEWTANHLTYYDPANKETYNLYPWQSKIYDITGWVTGLLDLPQLTATISPSDIVFCDQGGNSCVEADWPAGECLQLVAQYGPSPGAPTPPPPLGNVHPESAACEETPYCLPLVVSLTPTGNTTLSVTGVEPNGALNLQVTTSAVTTLHLVASPTTIFTCQDDPTRVPLSTVTPSSLPATAPSPPTPPNQDDRGLQTTPQPLTGPLSSSTSTVASNDFQIPAFIPSPNSTPCSVTLTEIANTYTGGWNALFEDQSEGLYYVEGGRNPVVAQQGWAQFSATTTVVDFGLPVGPPAGFKF